MHPALWISKTGLDAQQTQVSVISNNLANVNTVGYKKSKPVFEDLLYQNVRQPGGATSEASELNSGLMLGTGVKVVATQRNFMEGSILQTSNPTDIAINGRGFFQILLPDNTTAFTRDGSFQLDAEGNMVTSSGYALADNINVPAGATGLSVGVDGTVSAVLQGTVDSVTIGQIQLADFVNPSGLLPMGENLFKATTASGTATIANAGANGMGRLNQGALESSNVNVVEELVGLIEAQRAYEMSSKAVQTVDDMLQFASNSL